MKPLARQFGNSPLHNIERGANFRIMSRAKTQESSALFGFEVRSAFGAR
jgi:hypothetical protein